MPSTHRSFPHSTRVGRDAHLWYGAAGSPADTAQTSPSTRVAPHCMCRVSPVGSQPAPMLQEGTTPHPMPLVTVPAWPLLLPVWGCGLPVPLGTRPPMGTPILYTSPKGSSCTFDFQLAFFIIIIYFFNYSSHSLWCVSLPGGRSKHAGHCPGTWGKACTSVTSAPWARGGLPGHLGGATQEKEAALRHLPAPPGLTSLMAPQEPCCKGESSSFPAKPGDGHALLAHTQDWSK